MNSSRHFDRLEIFTGAASDVEARLYFRLPVGCGVDRLSGTLRGPHSAYAHTLPIEIAIRDCGSGDTVLAEAVVPNPCYWTPTAPYLYDAMITVAGHASWSAAVGLRRWATDGRDLRLEGRRVVLRGGALPGSLQQFHDAMLTRLAREPNSSLCEQASSAGVLLVAELPADASLATIYRLARTAAVGVILPEGNVRIDELPQGPIYAQRIAPGRSVKLASWANLAICQVADLAVARTQLAGCDFPVIGTTQREVANLAALRATCDQLQRDLAPAVDLAGYLVEPTA